MNKYLIHIVLLMLLISCDEKEEVNFSAVVDHEDNIQSYHLTSMFESANFELLNDSDSLFSLYLSDTEIEIANLNFDSTEKSRDKHRQQYHLIEKHQIKGCQVLLIGRSIISNGRNYSILFRILDGQNNILNSFTVAVWNESSNNFYGCKILNNWTEIVHVNNGKVIGRFSVDNQWNINRQEIDNSKII